MTDPAVKRGVAGRIQSDFSLAQDQVKTDLGTP
jgi:hypothetical protein